MIINKKDGDKMNFIKYESIIESILFVAAEPVHIEKIAKAIEKDEETTKVIIKNLSDFYKNRKSGILIVQIENSYQMTTNPANFEYIEKLYKIPQKKVLTQALLETLAIIAYKQPVTKPQIEEIRGVSAEHTVNKLMEYGLIIEKGRMETIGKPIIFGTSQEFLKYFGFSTIKDIPELQQIPEKETTQEINNTL
jgi:segregation and condensation protein B